jgi:outer membrane protein TolC
LVTVALLGLAWAAWLGGAALALDDPATPSAEAWASEPLRRSQVIAAALASHPSLEAVRRRVEAARARVSQAGAPDDPMVFGSVSSFPLNPFAFGAEPMTMRELGVAQKVPWPGKLSAMAQMARADADAMAVEVGAARLMLIQEASRAYAELYEAERGLTIIAHHRHLFKDAVRLATTRYGVGQAGQGDVLKAQLALTRLREREIIWRGQAAKARATLNTLIGRPTGALLGEPAFDVPLAHAFDAHALERLAHEHNVELRSQRAMIAARQVARRKAKLDYYPDFELRLSYAHRNMQGRSDLVSGMVGINLPVWTRDKQDAAVREVDATITQLKAEIEAKIRAIDERLATLLAELQQRREQIQLYEKGLLPQARRGLRAMFAEYQGGKGDFLMFHDQAAQILDLEIDAVMARAAYARAFGELEVLIGVPLVPDTRGEGLP